MKKSELRSLIREEIQKVLTEATPKFADPKAKYLYALIGSAFKDKKIKQLQKEFDKYSIELPLQNLKQAEDALVRSDWDAIDWKELKAIQQSLNKVNEVRINNFTPKQKTAILPRPFVELLPATSKTIKLATKDINAYEGQAVDMHSQYFQVRPKSDETKLYYFGQSQYYTSGQPGLAVTELSIRDLSQVPEGESWTMHKDKVIELGKAYVNTDVFLKECKALYDIVKQGS